MNPGDIRERDLLVKMLRRRPPNLEAIPKPTTPELMGRLFSGIRDEYDQQSPARSDQARRLFETTKESE